MTRSRAILRQRTRYSLAQRSAGVPALGAANLDLVNPGNLGGCFMDVESLVEVLGMARHAACERVVEPIRGGWIEARRSPAGAGRCATEKVAAFTAHRNGTASAVRARCCRETEAIRLNAILTM